MKTSHVLTLLLGVSLSLPVSGADGTCRHLTLDPSPAWTYSGAWSADGRLVMVDVGQKTVWAYDPFTGTGEALWRTDGNLDQPGGPALIQRLGDSLLVEVNDVLHALGPAGLDDAPRARLADVSGLSGLRSVHSWAATGDRVLVYGDHYHPVAGWRPVLGLASLEGSSRLHILDTLSFEGPDRTFYMNSQGFLTISGDQGYVLALTPRPHLVEVHLETGELRTLHLPAALAPRVDLPPASGLDTTVLQQAALASAHRPAGIYAHEGLLYILSRHPRSPSPWRLTAYDPEQGKALSATILPTRAEHVVLVPGEQWAILEKGPFEGYGRQELLGVSIVPAAEVLRGGRACTRLSVARD